MSRSSLRMFWRTRVLHLRFYKDSQKGDVSCRAWGSDLTCSSGVGLKKYPRRVSMMGAEDHSRQCRIRWIDVEVGTVRCGSEWGYGEGVVESVIGDRRMLLSRARLPWKRWAGEVGRCSDHLCDVSRGSKAQAQAKCSTHQPPPDRSDKVLHVLY